MNDRLTATTKSGPDALKAPRFKIIVNAEPKVVHDDKLSFWEVVRLAFGRVEPNETTIFTVTYRKAASRPPEGHLVDGQSVKVKDGTIFNVTKTDKS